MAEEEEGSFGLGLEVESEPGFGRATRRMNGVRYIQ